MSLEQMPKVFTRFSEPSQLDTADQGTLILVMKDFPKRYELYKQISSNEENPVWIHMGAVKEIEEAS